MNKNLKTLFISLLSLALSVTFAFSAFAEQVVPPLMAPVPKNYSLSTTKTTYTGKDKKPTVTVTDQDGAVIDEQHYTVEYKRNNLPGKAAVIVTMNETGLREVLYFTILPKKASKPELKSIKQKQFTVTVGEDLTVSGYNIRYSSSSKFRSYKNSYMSVTTDVRKTIKVSKNTTYYVKVRNYKYIDGKKVYGEFSRTAKIKVSSSSAHAKLPTEMMESYIAQSLTYLNYKTEKHKALGSYLVDHGSGPRTPVSVRTGIGYGGGPLGTETVKDKSTVSGRAPDYKYFKRNGLCCASFVSYYYLNYLPNIAGVDTSFIKSAIKKSGYTSRTCEGWAYAGKYLVKKKKATVVDKVPNGSSLSAAHLEKLEIGDLICFRIPSTGRPCGHVAVYAGKNHHGDHFVAHVGSDEGPVFQTLQRFQNVVNRADGCAYSVVYRFKDVPSSKYDYSAKLKYTSTTYNGAEKRPGVVVKDATGKTMSKKYYTVHYIDNKKPGTAKVKIIFKGKHKGTKTLKFKIVKK